MSKNYFLTLILDGKELRKSDQTCHDQMIERLKREHLVHQQEARDLKQQLSKINQQFLLYEEESAKKDAKVAECQVKKHSIRFYKFFYSLVTLTVCYTA